MRQTFEMLKYIFERNTNTRIDDLVCLSSNNKHSTLDAVRTDLLLNDNLLFIDNDTNRVFLVLCSVQTIRSKRHIPFTKVVQAASIKIHAVGSALRVISY